MKNNGAADRPDLLEYLVGPKAFLFDYYELTVNENPENPKYPFRRKGDKENSFGYALDNSGPWHLEDEIRADFQHLKIALPSRLIMSSEVTIPLSEDEYQLQKYFFDQLKKWGTLPKEEELKVLQKIIDITGWQQFQIKPENIIAFTPPPHFSDMAKGVLEFHGLGLKFSFCLTNLKCSIEYEGYSLDSRDSSYYLEEVLRSVQERTTIT